jgi:hypothetical protein
MALAVFLKNSTRLKRARVFAVEKLGFADMA